MTEAAKLNDVLQSVGDMPLWYGQVDQTNTTIWAQFNGMNPNEQLVEINVRQTVFYLINRRASLAAWVPRSALS